MTEQEYTAIAAACDRLLLGEGTSLARVAIPLLHLINEHPGCTSVYTQPTLRAWEDSPRAALRAARALLRALRQKQAPASKGAIDVLIVSHLVNPAQLEQDEDLYFGPMQRLLTDRGITSTLVLVNHCPSPTPFNNKVLPGHAPAAVEARLWLQGLEARSALLQAARAARDPMDQRMATLASRHAWLAPTIANLRLHWQIAQICRQHTPKIVLTLYEGDACERLIWHAARSNAARVNAARDSAAEAASNSPLCVGYQHAGVLPRAHAIRRPINRDYDPDVILTAGEIQHAMLAGSPVLATTRLIRYGSHRATSIQARATEPPGNTCLVLPDAAPDEYAVLFEFAKECARLNPETTFKLRPHPATAARALLGSPCNMILSKKTTLAEDCATARYCLYRGSSAVIQAVIAGVKPFYVKQENELPFDPIADLEQWRETISTPAELASHMGVASSAEHRQAAASFCKRYTSPLRPEALTELLNLARQ
jgi:hypothetical protein